MECGYYNSFVFGWYCIGFLSGFLTNTFCVRRIPRKRYRNRVIPIEYITDPKVTPKNEDNLGSYKEEGCKGNLGSSKEEGCKGNLGSPGDRVMVSLPPGETPSFGWGGVNPDDIGVIVSTATEYFKGNTSCYRIDFPNHKYWLGLETELCRV